ncbi:MAG: thiolase family protein [Deltaproteobacteria bacterium]|nr:thiolase family protein [Deltaproteobacteria bacterium]
MREVVVVSTVRTALSRAKNGGLKDTRPDDLMGMTLAAALTRAGTFDPALIDDVIVGTAFPEGEQGMNIARIASFVAGLPYSVPAMTINRFCSSGLESLATGAAGIMAGWKDIVLTGGVESMTMIPMGGQKPAPNPRLMAELPESYSPMGTTAENVAERFGVSREDQDAFSAQSHDRALAAIEAGKFKDEIHPIATRVYENGAWKEVVVDTDEGPRPGTTAAGLAKLKPVFSATGSVTAGSSSQLTNGAGANLIAAREVAEKLGLPILATLRSYQVVGVPPDIMGVGPLYAIPKAVEAAGLTLADIGLFEINEAFAAQAVYCVRELGISQDIVNVNGGAIALGHPLGATGARMVATLLNEMRRRGTRYGVVSMCIGGGMGAAAVFELEQ